MNQEGLDVALKHVPLRFLFKIKVSMLNYSMLFVSVNSDP